MSHIYMAMSHVHSALDLAFKQTVVSLKIWNKLKFVSGTVCQFGCNELQFVSLLIKRTQVVSLFWKRTSVCLKQTEVGFRNCRSTWLKQTAVCFAVHQTNPSLFHCFGTKLSLFETNWHLFHKRSSNLVETNCSLFHNSWHKPKFVWNKPKFVSLLFKQTSVCLKRSEVRFCE